MENYVSHRDVMVHKKRTRFYITVFILPIFLVLLVELFVAATNRELVPLAHNTYTVENTLYISPLASSPVGHIQVGIGGSPPTASSSAK